MIPPSFTLVSIVEGHGDQASIPLLVRRLKPRWHVPMPFRVGRWKLVKGGVLERYAQIASRRIVEYGGKGGILVAIDAETDPACQLGPELLRRLQQEVSHLPGQVVLAIKCFEAWLIAGGVVRDSEGVDPEAISSPKRWIKDRLGHYQETVDQPSLAARMDLDQAAERCPSFGKFLRCLDCLEA